ncbi:MAG: acyl-CoA thioesterase [Desulfosoma sp.]|uniref:acyl-CoA thioesterase n=2 Tax=Desulfosoma sp. TaxID=2603217 RepID=UPI00404AEB08
MNPENLLEKAMHAPRTTPKATRASVRVLYADTDAMGQAYYGHYMRWFEAGRAEWFRHLGTTYRRLEEQGIFLPVIEAHCRYLRPAFYDDVLEVETCFQFAGPARLRFDYRLHRCDPQELLAHGYTVHVCVNGDRKPLKPPAWLRDLLSSNAVEPADAKAE